MLSNRLYDKYKKRLNLFRIIITLVAIVILIKFFSIQILSGNLYKKQISIQTRTDVKKEGDGLRVDGTSNIATPNWKGSNKATGMAASSVVKLMKGDVKNGSNK